MVNFAVLTISDSCSEKKRLDESGSTLQQLITSSSQEFNVVQYKIISDDFDIIKSTLISLCDRVNSIDIVVTTGGTGFSARDVTPEATKSVIEKEANGLSLAILSQSLKITKFAALSRLVCGIRNKTLIANFPGSKKAVQECWQALEPLIMHISALLNEDMGAVQDKHENLAIVTTKKHGCHCQHSTLEDDSVRASKYPMVEMDEAQKIVASCCKRLNRKIMMDIEYSCGYILAEDILAPFDQPNFDASIKDGYAVLASDGAGKRQVLGCIAASSRQTENPALESGTCLKINTGAPLPPGADAVVQVEDTELCALRDDGQESEICIKKAPIVGQDIRPKGSDLVEGQLLLSQSSTITSVEIGILASIGRQQVSVYEKPRVAIFSTGDELYDPKLDNNKLPFGAIFDSNSPMLRALFEEHGFKVQNCGILKDDQKSVAMALSRALDENDVLVTTGGVSMGDKDFLKDVLLKDLKCQIHFGRLFMKPGKPTTFATCRDRLIFALPGNPVSAWVTGHLLIMPALKRLSGFEKPDFTRIKVQLVNDRWTLDPRPEYVRASLILDQNSTFKAYISEENQTSSRLLSNKNANLLLEMPRRTERKSFVEKNEILDALLIGNF